MIVKINEGYVSDWNYYIYTLLSSILIYMLFFSDSDFLTISALVQAIAFNMIVIGVGLFKLLLSFFKYTIKIKWFCYIWIGFLCINILSLYT